ncbi:unnamed protein product [Phyllotreta striolata]|uniref:WD repeat-containing protein 75 second beta-propeller domain-containing protein n=1 Tax=Phyllotreta striolata TaxID=444603 RepID=A0A9P0E193_PHYSR|nr:unnamed protein product [Phyllotreta striolata]
MDLLVNYKGGGSFVKLPPQFSDDSQNVFVCSKNSILEYNTKTAKLLYEYKTSNRIIGYGYHSLDGLDALTACTENGEISTWKVLTHSKVVNKKLSLQNVQTFFILPSDEGNYKAVTSYTKGDTIHFALWSSKTNKIREYNLKLPIESKYFIDVQSEFFGVAVENEIYFVKINDFQQYYKRFIGNERVFTCIACHPVEEIILSGDNTGRVLKWQNLFSKKPNQSVFHWHTLPVNTVSFSHTGSYFYSGGGESVLVKWLLENVNEKKFVPRLPAQINHIKVSRNNLYVAVSTNDNAVRIFDNTLYQISLIQHLVLADHFDSGIVYDLRSRSLIMNGNQGHIQFYSPEFMSLVHSVDIVGQNRITNERGIVIANTEVKKVAISKNGLWFATVEERKDDELSSEIRLKFWRFEESKQEFHLNTSIEYPHEDSINSMLFAPVHKDDNLQCVTVGDDKKFKIWKVTETMVVTEKRLSWKCFSVGFYRNLPCNALSFSIDGSLFATGFKEILTLWTPDTCSLKSSLIYPLHKETIKHIHFGNESECHLLVTASDNTLNVWNILTLCMMWTVPLKVSHLIADSLSSNMAVITRTKRVYVFSPNSSQPLYTNEKILQEFGSIKACNFIPSRNINDLRLNWYQRTQLYFITSENELYCLRDEEVLPGILPSELNEDQALYEKVSPQVKVGSIKSIEAQKHLYMKDPSHRAFKTVRICCILVKICLTLFFF